MQTDLHPHSAQIHVCILISTDLTLAKSILAGDGLVAVPTETVYGLAGNALSPVAVRKIFALKQRPAFNPLIVHVGTKDALEQVAAEVPDGAWRLAQEFWPGPLTLVLPKRNIVPDEVTAGKSTVAIRMPAHELTLALLRQLDFPLAAPSANPFGSISPTTAQHVDQYFGERLPLVLDGGPCQRGIESTIVGFVDGQAVLYRLGSISASQIEAVVGPLWEQRHDDTAPAAPGMLSRHYAPATPAILVSDLPAALAEHGGRRVGLLLYRRPDQLPAVDHLEVLSANGDIEEAARNLYAALHRLDAAGLDLIIAERVPAGGVGAVINDRLERAVVGR